MHQVPLDEWEVRAIMEKRRANEAREAAFREWRSEVGRYPMAAADWRSDVRIRDTGNPTDPTYREWTHRWGPGWVGVGGARVRSTFGVIVSRSGASGLG